MARMHQQIERAIGGDTDDPAEADPSSFTTTEH
jgi:hypothetical protein